MIVKPEEKRPIWLSRNRWDKIVDGRLWRFKLNWLYLWLNDDPYEHDGQHLIRLKRNLLVT
jgi:hypothetical protein